MKAKLPNLELLEYQAKLTIKNNSFLMQKRRVYFDKNGHEFYGPEIEFECSVFAQKWPTENTAFQDNSALLSSSASYKAYTVVFYEPVCNSYVVFVDSKLCYVVDEPNADFLEDLKNHELRDVVEAREFY